MMNIFAIGDIHGQYDKFSTLLQSWNPVDETLILLGDLIDRGNHSLDVIRTVMELKKKYRVVVLLGNHEEMFLNWLEAPEEESILYLNQGGFQTVSSFVGEEKAMRYLPKHLAALIKNEYTNVVKFLSELPLYYETEDYIFAHAGVNLDLRNWKNSSTRDFNSERHRFIYGENQTGKTIVFGHTQTRLLHNDKKNNDIWISPCGTKIGIDGGACSGGKLHGLRINKSGYDVISA